MEEARAEAVEEAKVEAKPKEEEARTSALRTSAPPAEAGGTASFE